MDAERLRPHSRRADFSDECPTPPPAAWSTSPASAFYVEAKRVYDVGRALTEEQRQTVLYWAEVTYIRRYIDSAWTPAFVTPPFPEYPSGHSGQSASAATVLTALLGPVTFEDGTDLALGRCVGRMVLERLHTRAQPTR